MLTLSSLRAHLHNIKKHQTSIYATKLIIMDFVSLDWLHGSKLTLHFSGSCMAMLRSTPEIGGPLTRTHKQGWPRTLIALQQASFGGMGLNGATDARQGISCTNAEKKVLPHGCAKVPWTQSPITTTSSTTVFALFSIVLMKL